MWSSLKAASDSICLSFLCFYCACHAFFPVQFYRQYEGGGSASDMRTAHTCGDHYGTENRQKAAGKVLGAVYEAREYLSRKPSGDDDAQDVSGGRV